MRYSHSCFYEFRFKPRNLINELLNTVACDNADVQYIELGGSTDKNFGLLIIDELKRMGFIKEMVTQDKTKLGEQ